MIERGRWLGSNPSNAVQAVALLPAGEKLEHPLLAAAPEAFELQRKLMAPVAAVTQRIHLWLGLGLGLGLGLELS